MGAKELLVKWISNYGKERGVQLLFTIDESGIRAMREREREVDFKRKGLLSIGAIAWLLLGGHWFSNLEDSSGARV